MSDSPEAQLWKRRWAAAYEWETLVHVLEFRQDACTHFFNVKRDFTKNSFLPYDPSDRQHCAYCQKGKQQECLFFHPSLATIFLDIIGAFGRTKMGSATFNNTDLLDRVFSLLPAHYTELGHPCQRGRIWACVLDKLHQTFPRELFMMLNIRESLQKAALEKEAYWRFENRKTVWRETPPKSPSAVTRSELTAVDSNIEDSSEVPASAHQPCRCRFYFEGDCSVYEEYMQTLGVGLASQAYADYRSRKTTLEEYIQLLRDKVNTDWDSAPLCTELRVRVFYQKLCRQHCDENRAKEAAVVAAKKASAAKYKQSKLRTRQMY